MLDRQRVLAVVVLYKMRFEQSRGLASLLTVISRENVLASAIDLMVCDNTPYEQQVPDGFSGQFYRDTTNPGLAHWYNIALKNAEEAGIDWLLLLDQDTEVTDQYVREVVAATEAMERNREIVALVPKLEQNGIVCSPLIPPTYRPPLPFNKNFTGVASSKLHVFNSGSVLRVSALRDIGGFPQDFPLDYLDHATFAALQSHKGRLFVLESVLMHELSSNEIWRTDAAAIARHRSTLLAEQRFYDLNGSVLDRIYRRIRLFRGALGILVRHGAIAWSFRMMRAALR